MPFGIYTIQFYIQSSLPLLRRFLLVSPCYIPIVERMYAKKIMNTNSVRFWFYLPLDCSYGHTESYGAAEYSSGKRESHQNFRE